MEDTVATVADSANVRHALAFVRCSCESAPGCCRAALLSASRVFASLVRDCASLLMLALSHLIDQRAQPGNTAAALRRPAQVHLAVRVHLVCLWPRISRLLVLC